MLVFTSCTNNYLPKARVLARSLKNLHPDWQFCLLLGETPPEGFQLQHEPFDRLLGFDELPIVNFRPWMFGHRLVELCTAVKGVAMNHFLETEGQPKVIYLDPDILVLDSLQPLADLLDQHDILLTPHQLAPQKSLRAIEDNEISSLRHGIFNLGFLACANRPEGVAFSRFWRHRLENYCRDELAQGLFTDQKWCDLAPAYFPSTGIVRDPGCNAASWNLTDRIISQDGKGRFLANGTPLRFYHFTGYDSGMGQVMSRAYGSHMPAVGSLWEHYAQLLREAGQDQAPAHPWAGGLYSDGTPIADAARIYYRDNPAVQALYPDPYMADDGQGFAQHWREHQRREGNTMYVWVRKPFRLAALTHQYLRRRGGLRALPALCRRVCNTWQQEGLKGLLAKVRKFKQSCAPVAMSLKQLLAPPNAALKHWLTTLQGEFGGQRGVLILDHMYGGGANEYRERRIGEFLAEGRPCLLATWDFFGGRLHLTFLLPDGRRLLVQASDLEDLLRQDKLAFGAIVVNELVLWSKAGHADGSHYQALGPLLKTVIALKERHKATLEVAVHDFYAICPSYNLLERGETYCHVSTDVDRCQSCLRAGPFRVPINFELSAWRKAWGALLEHADVVRVFSRESIRLLRLCYPIRDAQICYTPHSALAALPPTPPAPGPLHIGVVGHIAFHKGAQVVRDLAPLLAPGERLTVIGSLEGPVPPGVVVTGPYDRTQLPAMMREHGINACLVPSICPETFCYAAQEVMQMQLPLVVFPLGAQAERVQGYAQGAVATDISAASALHSLRQMRGTCD